MSSQQNPAVVKVYKTNRLQRHIFTLANKLIFGVFYEPNGLSRPRN